MKIPLVYFDISRLILRISKTDHVWPVIALTVSYFILIQIDYTTVDFHLVHFLFPDFMFSIC